MLSEISIFLVAANTDGNCPELAFKVSSQLHHSPLLFDATQPLTRTYGHVCCFAFDLTVLQLVYKAALLSDLLALWPRAVWPVQNLLRLSICSVFFFFSVVRLLRCVLQSWLMLQDCFFAVRTLCTSVNGLQFIPCVSAIEAWECSGFHFNYTLKPLISQTSLCLMLIRE